MKYFIDNSTYSKENDINRKNYFSISKVIMLACITLILSTCDLFMSTTEDEGQEKVSLVAVSAPSDEIFVITNTGALYAWGLGFGRGTLGLGDTDSATTPTKVNVAGVNGWRSVDAGSVRVFAITDTGALYAWGENKNGELGLGLETKKIEPHLRR